MEKPTRSTRTYLTERPAPPPMLASARRADAPAGSRLVTFGWAGLTSTTRRRR